MPESSKIVDPAANPYADWSERALIRQWWYEYLQILRRPGGVMGEGGMAPLHGLTAELKRRGVVKEGCPMVRSGAEDLARDCDLARGRKP